jgi:hypothetical protein
VQVLKELDPDTLQKVVPLVCRIWRTCSQSTAVWKHRLHPHLLELAAPCQGGPCNSSTFTNPPSSSSHPNPTSSSINSNRRPSHSIPPSLKSTSTSSSLAWAADQSCASGSIVQPQHQPQEQQQQLVVPLALLHYAVHARNFLRNPAFLQSSNSDIARLLRIRGSSAAKTYEQKLEAWVRHLLRVVGAAFMEINKPGSLPGL